MKNSSWNETMVTTIAWPFVNFTTSLLPADDPDRSHGGPDTWLIYASYITFPLLLTIGICGNSLTLMVIRTHIYRNSSHGIYLTAMAISDMVFLLSFPFSKNFTHDLFGRDIRALHTVSCKLYFFVYRATRATTASLITQICVERFVAVWFPLQTKALSTRRAAVIGIICICVAIAMFCAVWAVVTVGVENNNCVPGLVTADNKMISDVCSIIGMTVRTCLPAITLLLLTPLTIGKLYYMRSRRRHLGCNHVVDDSYRVTLMLVSVNVAFLMFVTPFCIAKHVFRINGIDIVTSPDRLSRNLYEVLQICELINCVINFILYVLLSSTFRRQVCVFFNRKRIQNRGEVSKSVDTLASRFR